MNPKDLSDLKKLVLLEHKKIVDAKRELEASEEKDRFSEEIFVKLVEALVTHQRVTDHSLVNPPSIIIFESIATCFPEIRSSAAELQEKYFNFAKNKTPNIDENIQKPLSRDDLLRPFKKYLCRKCFMYGCVLHAHEENISPKSYERKEPHN
ncbi:Histone-lysine N-methyltransferase E(z) [Pseudolycoriella hygida]|uniref:Histone-lysine N-methyltransferase E(Z) n=1 Tax=Pseudolycoriella hygida TaxID=35572 RepID=A0A9Q0MU09_9DIPT|nr:Histone-lysine N-methyltransferase E(z) [Pseudolycoriella hygida]